MSGLFRAFDAAYPPPAAPAGCHAAFGYIGGNTPHVWTRDEWARFAHLRQAPIWVADLRLDAPTGFGGQGRAAAAAAAGLGWTAYGEPDRRIIWLDMETWVNPAWVNGFADAVKAAGYVTGVYGSQSTVYQNPARTGYWIAEWDGVPDVAPGVLAHQYAADVATAGGGVVDLSSCDGSLWPLLGYGPRT